MDIFLLVPYFITIVICTVGANENITCDSPQYLAVGTVGTLSCSSLAIFSGSFYWYKSTEYVADTPLIYIKNSYKKGGSGYESGEFDIQGNGSLVIKNVTLEHDHYFTAVRLHSLEDVVVPHYVRAIPIVKPHTPYPVINQCGRETNICVIQLSNRSNITCSVENSRPAVSIMWIARTAAKYKIASSQPSFTSTGILNTSTATIDSFPFPSLLMLFICRVNSPQGMLLRDQSLLVVQNNTLNLNPKVSIKRHCKVHSRVELPCKGKKTVVVWKKKRSSKEFDTVLVAVYDKNTVEKSEKNGFQLGDNGTLIINNVDLSNEGYYGCIFSDESINGMILYEVAAYVLPEPSNPTVEGCNNTDKCVLEVNITGLLTCLIRNVYPMVSLEWVSMNKSAAWGVSFYHQETTTRNNIDGTFDVTVLARYAARPSPQFKRSVKCTVVSIDNVFQSFTKVDLLFPKDIPEKNNAAEKGGATSKIYIMVITGEIVFGVLLISAVIFIAGKICRGDSSIADLSSENMPMLESTPRPSSPSKSSSSTDKTGLKERFITNLKVKYEDMCAKILPLSPNSRSMYKVNQIFVDNEIEFLVKSDHPSRLQKWEILESYQDVLRDPRLTSPRLIVEGEAGQGKSVLCLQFAHNWCCRCDGSYLNDIEIFILLRLRQLGNVPSIYRAIRELLLPKDTEIGENDIKEILQKSTSVLMVFDGFDEYPGKDNDSTSDVISIIRRDMLQQHKVIVTTRLSCLPKEHSPLAERIRLRGFSDNARKLYIQRILHSDNTEITEKILGIIKKSPFLEDLCQVPLFLAFFVHICNEGVDVSNLHSLTSVCRCIILCFHNHMESKINKKEKAAIYCYQKQHRNLDRLAYKTLCGSFPEGAWNMENLCKEVGQKFCQYYVDTGILVVEEQCSIADISKIAVLQTSQQKTKVRFYHNIFCEWYAAHFLSDMVANSEYPFDVRDEFYDSSQLENGSFTPRRNTEDNILKPFDPFYFEYLYRFMCGLSSDAAEKIHEYLTTLEGGDLFRKQCIIESSGGVENVVKAVRNYCSSGLTIHSHYTPLQQRSIIQLLEIATTRMIAIPSLMLCDCFRSVDPDGKHIVLTSGTKLRSLATLEKLVISEEGRELTCDETINILKYALACTKLKVLRFDFSVMPRTVEVQQLYVLQERNLEVLWETNFYVLFRFINRTGQWENKEERRLMTDAEYNKARDVFHSINR